MCAFFGPKTLFFRVRVLCQNNPFFGPVFFAENLGEGGGGEEFWDALLLRGGLNWTCVAAWPKGPQRRKSRGKGRDPLGQKHATWQPTGYNRWPPQKAVHAQLLSFFPALLHANGKEIQLDSASETPSYGSCQVCLRHWRWLLSPQNKLRERSLS